MPNVTEEFLDLQGLQDYDYAIKNYIDTGLNDKADESDIQTLESEIGDKADSSDLQNLESDVYAALATKADASALDNYLPITGGSYDEDMSIDTSGNVTVESEGDVAITGDDNASISSGNSFISLQSAAASGSSVFISAEEGGVYIDSDHRVVIEGVQHSGENNAIHILAQGNTIDIDGGTIRLLSDYGIYGSHDNHNPIKVLLSDVIGNEEDVTSYGAVAQNSYSVGELFCGNDTRIYRATQSISMGDTLDSNTNYEYVGTIVELTDTKVDKVSGKGLSTEDYTTAEKSKLAGIANNADNVSWTQTVATGTKIAEITINGVTQNVYVPSLPQAESEVV